MSDSASKHTTSAEIMVANYTGTLPVSSLISYSQINHGKNIWCTTEGDQHSESLHFNVPCSASRNLALVLQTHEPQQFTKEAKGSIPQQNECFRMQPTAVEHLLILVDVFFLPAKITTAFKRYHEP